VSADKKFVQAKWHKNGMCEWPGLKSADLDSSDKWQKWQSGFQKQAISNVCGNIKAAAVVKRLDKIPKNLNRPVMDCKHIYRHGLNIITL